MTDSRSACSRYIQGSITPLAASLLQAASWRFSPHSVRIVWTPGHTGLPGNEVANAAGRASLFRAAALPCPVSDPENSSLTRYRDILDYYRTSRRLYPGPARGLAKADERILRRLQTNAFLSPAVARHFIPETLARARLVRSSPTPFTSWLRVLQLVFLSHLPSPSQLERLGRSTCSAAPPWMLNAPW